jgi:two-component system response regulator CpxR
MNAMSFSSNPEPMDWAALSLLLIDDDVELCDLMRQFFEQRGLRLETVFDGRRGLARALDSSHHLILLDVMLPGIDGFELLRLLRRQSSIPVIMLTARTSQADRVTGLDAGADDYLPKPFGPEELLARIRAVLRRAGGLARTVAVLECNGLRVLPASRTVECEGLPVALTTVEYDILEFLMHAAGRTVSRAELTSALYRRARSPFDRALDVHISNLRKKLGASGGLIQTVRGVGYLFPAGMPPGEGV